MNLKFIFICGFARSGKSIVRKLLNKHREIVVLTHTRLVESKIFLDLPKLIFECPTHLRTPLLEIFKQLCTTYIYCRLMFPKKNFWNKAWLYYERIWLLRLQFPQSLLCNNHIWKLLEKLWTPGLLKKLISHPDHKRGFSPVGHWRGLHESFKKEDIKQCFVHLDRLKDVSTLKEAYLIYGKFWSSILNGYAKERKKRYWAIEETDSWFYHTPFLKQCFPNFKLINVVRDGRDSACYANELWGTSIRWFLDRWAKILTQAQKVQANATGQNYINIRYEDLVYNTQGTLKRITDFLEVDFEEDMLSFPIHSSAIGRYKSVFDSELKNYARDHYGSLFNQWGYPT